MKKGTFRKLSFEEAKLKLKQKVRKPLARSQRIKKAQGKVKKPKLKTISQLKKILWKLVSDYIRNRDEFFCYTCSRHGQGSQIHAGHMVPNAAGGALLRYHPKNINAQCYHCNINLGGFGVEYLHRFILINGLEEYTKLVQLKNHSIQADRYFFETMIELYKQGDEEEIVKFLETYI